MNFHICFLTRQPGQQQLLQAYWHQVTTQLTERFVLIYLTVYTVNASTAAEMWCLARLLPLMIGEHVPEDDHRWGLFKIFLMIVDYVFAPNTEENIIEYIRKLIEDHHFKFRELPNNTQATLHIPDWMTK